MAMRRHIFFLALLGGCLSTTVAARVDTNLEKSVCNSVLEPFAFWLWQRSAGTPYLLDDRLPAGVEVIHHRTQDGRLLHGYRLIARTALGVPAKGFVLVAQGNATLVERLVGRLRDIANSGYDIYMYDYRGYGRSEGKWRRRALERRRDQRGSADLPQPRGASAETVFLIVQNDSAFHANQNSACAGNFRFHLRLFSD